MIGVSTAERRSWPDVQWPCCPSSLNPLVGSDGHRLLLPSPPDLHVDTMLCIVGLTVYLDGSGLLLVRKPIKLFMWHIPSSSTFWLIIDFQMISFLIEIRCLHPISGRNVWSSAVESFACRQRSIARLMGPRSWWTGWWKTTFVVFVNMNRMTVTSFSPVPSFVCNSAASEDVGLSSSWNRFGMETKKAPWIW